MPYLASWSFGLVIMIVLLGVIVACILFFEKSARPFQSKMLGAGLLCIALVLLNNELMSTDFYLNNPHLWKVIVPAAFGMPAFLFIYIHAMIVNAKGFNKKYLVLFIPAALFILNLVPFYTLSLEEKKNIIEKVIDGQRVVARETEGWLPFGIGVVARIGYGICLAAVQFALLFRWRQKHVFDLQALSEKNEIYSWLFLLSTVIFMMYMLMFAIAVLQLNSFLSIWQSAITIMSISLLFLCYYLLTHPNIRKGFPVSGSEL